MGQADGGHGFKGWLERGLGSGGAAGGSSIAERMEQRVEAQVMGRVRALGGRAGGVDAREDRTGHRADEARPARGTADDERAESERLAERSHERDEQSRDAGDGVGGAMSPGAPRDAPRSLSLDERARSLQAADSADASGAEAPASEGASRFAASGSNAGFAPVARASAQQNAGAGVSAAAVHGAPPTGATTVAGAAPTNTSTNGLPGVAVDGPRAAAGSKVAAAAEPLPHTTPTEDLELAEQVMRQLRARLQLGQREALIELRPSELGRIGVHLRFEDGALIATIRAERPETLAVLEAHAPELRAWLAQDGKEVREIDLGLAQHGALFDKRQHDGPLGRRSGGANARERASEAVQALPRTNTGEATPSVGMSSADMSSVDLLV
jgi:hypothetical protein